MLEEMPDDWDRMLAIAAHPDDFEYGAASAVARWTSEGKEVSYLLVTHGEAGIDAIDPLEAAPLREAEQRASASIVGVEDVTFLGHLDGTVEYSTALRRDMARHIRRLRPQVLLTTNGELTFGERILNQADHRTVSLAVLDAARDAGNRWIHRELADEGLEPWPGVDFVYLVGADDPTHGVDVGDWLAQGIDSLCAHGTYLEGLGRDFDARLFVRAITAQMGEDLGVRHAVAFKQIRLAGV